MKEECASMCVCVCQWERERERDKVREIWICSQLVEDRLAVTAATSVNNQVQWSVATPQLFSIQMSYEFSLFRITLVWKKKIISWVVRIGEYPPGRELFMLWGGKKWKKRDHIRSIKVTRKCLSKRNSEQQEVKWQSGGTHYREWASVFLGSRTLLRWMRTRGSISEKHGRNCRGTRGPLDPQHQSLKGEKEMLGCL